MQPPRSEQTGGLEALYPFLYAGQSHLAPTLQAVQRSTVAKVREIVALR